MGAVIQKFLGTLAFTLGIASSAIASPLNFMLLPLVPPDARIVAGFENYTDSHRYGQLLLTTHADRLDFADWQSIAGVDSERVLREVVEVAAALPDGELTKHLVLVAGKFDRQRIFNSAQMNGAAAAEFEGQPVLLIKPFDREYGDMVETRWLAILENRIGLLGSPSMVQQAIRRYANHSDVDMVLRERLAQLRPDVSSWNVLVGTPSGTQGFLLHSGSRWAPLFENAEMLMVGVRFGPQVRVDFSVHAARERGLSFFTQKATSFPEIFADEAYHPRLRNVVYETNRVQGSIQMPSKQFDIWSEQANHPRASQAPPSRGE